MNTTIKTTTGAAIKAHNALTRLNEENRWSEKLAWHFATLLGKLESVVKTYIKARAKIIKDIGGVSQPGGAFQLPVPTREADETTADWDARRKKYEDDMKTLDERFESLDEQPVEITYHPVKKRDLTDDEEKDKKNPKKYSANDLAACVAAGFIVGEEEKVEDKK